MSTPPKNESVGFIGPSNMGTLMAADLRRAHFPLIAAFLEVQIPS